MKDGIFLAAGALLAAVAAALTVALASPRSDTAGSRAGGAPVSQTEPVSQAEIDRLEEALAELRERQERLEERLREVASLPRGSSRSQVFDLDAAVARYFAERPTASETDPAGGGEAAGEAAASAETAEVVRQLLSGELDDDAAQSLWRRLREEGQLDEVTAELERLAEANRHDPDLLTTLGEAYIQKIYDVGQGPMAGFYGQKADEAFDAALDADPNHWEARFSKALALSHWPPFLGKGAEAMRQLEVLVEQQEARAPEDRFALTYLFLGNMYRENGREEEAAEIWRKGLALFPMNEALASKAEELEAAGQ